MRRAVVAHQREHDVLGFRQIAQSQHGRVLAMEKPDLALFIEVVLEQPHRAPHRQHVVDAARLPGLAHMQKPRRCQIASTAATPPQRRPDEPLAVLALRIFPGGGALPIRLALKHLLGEGGIDLSGLAIGVVQPQVTSGDHEILLVQKHAPSIESTKPACTDHGWTAVHGLKAFAIRCKYGIVDLYPKLRKGAMAAGALILGENRSGPQKNANARPRRLKRACKKHLVNLINKLINHLFIDGVEIAIRLLIAHLY